MEVEITKELLEKARTAKSAEELLELAKAGGITVTMEEAQAYFARLHTATELSDEELENVAGSGCDAGKPNDGSDEKSGAKPLFF